MRSLTFSTAIMIAILASNPSFAQNGGVDNYSIELNKTEIVRLPRAASAILVGNPDIADVSVHSLDTIFVVGRGYGETNLIILDQAGNKMLEADLNVVNTLPDHGVRLFNAKQRETYSCIPYCQPSPVLGDNTRFVSNNTNTNPELTPASAFLNNSTNSANRNNNTTSDLAGPNDSLNDGDEFSQRDDFNN